MIKKGINWKIGNGENIKFWEEPWIPFIGGFKIYSNKPEDSNIEYVRDVITETREWDIEKLQNEISNREIASRKYT